MIRAVRGAIKVPENTEEAIFQASVKLVSTVLKQNAIPEQDIISVIYSVTKDLNKANPAAGLRNHGFREVPLFCVQEADIEGSLNGIIRVLLTYNTEKKAYPCSVYLDGAEALRPDLQEPGIRIHP